MFKEMIKRNTSEHFLLKQLIKKNFTAKYKDSILGIIMEFYKPIVNYAFINCNFFNNIFRKYSDYPVYFLAGQCLFDFFSAGTKIAMNSIKETASI